MSKLKVNTFHFFIIQGQVVIVSIETYIPAGQVDQGYVTNMSIMRSQLWIILGLYK